MTFDEALIDMFKTGREWVSDGLRYRVYRNRTLQYRCFNGEWSDISNTYDMNASYDWQPVDAPVAEPKPYPPFDVIASFRAGKKIRIINWTPESYISLRGEQICNRHDEASGMWADWMRSLVLHPDQWEPYVEPVKLYNHAEAARLIAEGKTVASESCGITEWKQYTLTYSYSADLARIATATDFRVVEDCR